MCFFHSINCPLTELTSFYNVYNYHYATFDDAVICYHTIFVNVHYCRLENLPMYMCSYKNNTLKISHF